MSEVLDPVEHHRLIADIEGVCSTANVQQIYVRQSMSKFCTPTEVQWVGNFRENRAKGLGGLLLTGVLGDRYQAITGALIRNFIDARVVSVNQLVAASNSQGKNAVEIPDPTVLVIPNLFVSSHGKAMTSWQIQSLYDILLGRLTANRPTVAYVESLAGVADAYGVVFAEHLTTHFTQSS